MEIAATNCIFITTVSDKWGDVDSIEQVAWEVESYT